MSKKLLDLTKLQNVDRAAAAIHKVDSAKAPAGLQSVRTTIDVPREIHKRIKMKIYEKEWTIREYILDLVRRDLNLPQ